ncbi:SMAD domain Dwarfin-type [Trinorchestia longiramus]|nr:SMAD domain Dwarfin-type [Trinorchestia longiramus]
MQKHCESYCYINTEEGHLWRLLTGGWCSLRYWEKDVRVGQPLEVSSNSVSVVGSSSCLLADSGLCLNLLSAHPNSSETSLKIKNKIGLGILICREDSEVWLYNQSSVDVFVSSAALPHPIDDSSRPDTTSVRKIEAGHTLKIFSFELANRLSRITSKRTRRNGRVDIFCVNVSFCKGWGVGYTRREITSCPCRLELLLEPPR